MEYKKIKHIATITMGQSPDSSSYNEEENGIPFYQGNADFGELYPTARVWCSAPKKTAKKNDILISVRAPIGALNYATEECCIGRGLAAITIENDFERNYVFHLLKARNKELNNKGTGSTFKAIGKSVLEELHVPAISAEQQEISMKLMDTIEQIIRQRKRELQCLGDLIKARFVEMFGDPMSAAKEEKVELSELCEKITDGEHGSVARISKGHPFLNAKHILKNGNIDWNTITFIGDADHQKIYKRCNPETGDILLTTTGTIGNVAIMPECEEVSMDRGITLLKINHKKVTSEFVAEMLKQESIQIQMGANVHASAIGHLFMNKVKKLPAILPTLEKQMEFTMFVHQADKSRFAVQRALDQTQLLFDSLMQKYFG